MTRLWWRIEDFALSARIVLRRLWWRVDLWWLTEVRWRARDALADFRLWLQVRWP